MSMKQSIDWDNLGFNAHETKSMYIAKFDSNGNCLDKGLVPYGDIKLSPAATVLNYGQGVFEGTKAYESSKNQVVFFRLEDNAKRFNNSCLRLCMPEIPNEIFVNAVKETVLDNLEYMPKKEQGSLYIRPLAFGSGPDLGVKPSSNYTFLVYVTPVGSYFQSGLKSLNVFVTDKYHRVATKSIGFAKAIGNYSGTLLPFKEITEIGYDEIVFLNASDENTIDEARSANIFILKDKTLKTPPVNGSILPGVTRDSVLKIGKNLFDLNIVEDDVTLEDLVNADEVFFTGTAVIVAPVGSISFKNKKIDYKKPYSDSMTKKIRETLIDIQNENIEDRFSWISHVN